MSGSSSVDRREFLAFLGSGAVYLVGCSGEASGPSPPPPPPPPDVSADVVIEMENIAFVAPDGSDDVTIQLGQTVGWINRDNVPHDPTSDQVPAGGNAFNSPLLSNGESFVFEPNVMGTWVYHCAVHPNDMAGATITVT